MAATGALGGEEDRVAPAAAPKTASELGIASVVPAASAIAE